MDERFERQLNVKRKYVVVYALVLLSIVIVGIFLAFLPDRVPMHYNMAGEINRFGSKYENLIFPLFVAVRAAVFVPMVKYRAKKGRPNNEKVLLIATIVVPACLIGTEISSLWKALTFSPAVPQETNSLEAFKFVAMGLGILMVVLGNLLPKSTRNSVVGLRISWSMKNDVVWQKVNALADIHPSCAAR